MQAGPRFFQSYRAIAEAFAVAMMRGFTSDNTDAVSESGAMTASGRVSPSNSSSIADTAGGAPSSATGAASSLAWKSAAAISVSIAGDIAALPAFRRND
jgi:hypothetical protein